jgi:hypothetical protein
MPLRRKVVIVVGVVALACLTPFRRVWCLTFWVDLPAATAPEGAEPVRTSTESGRP